ncbi:MAG: copper chaperone PCu(A)C [Hyphomicrobiaceae bacterium]|nr:copper chaperone PCu(A)C [Hyphomicrobiaceae bacterium]
MKSMIRFFTFFGIAVVAAGALFPAESHEFKTGDLTIDHPWARPSIGGVPNGAGYMIVINDGAEDDTLEAASSPVAKATEIHTHIKEGDVMKMRPVTGGVRIPAKAETRFESGGLHVMFLGLKLPLKEGDFFPVLLTFQKAGVVTVEFKVEKAGAKSENAHHKH